MCQENMAVERDQTRRVDRTKRRRADGPSDRRCKKVATAAGPGSPPGSMAPANTTQYLMDLVYADLKLGLGAAPDFQSAYLSARMESVRELRFHGD